MLRGAVFLLLILCACESNKSWEVSHVQSDKKDNHSSRLSYPVGDIVNGIGIEMICAQGLVNTYLEVHAQHIPPYQGNSKEALVILKIEGKTFQGIADRHEGGQRLSMPPQLHQLLIESLQLGRPVTILLEGYFTTLDPKEFSEQFRELQSPPINNPFQSPFKLL
ncbi:MAG TPA: hypothetical protein VMR37_00770 [Rhabdochlamydiaceae bacterium]|nr:hypothetical protein [Rhabdochlamydiaceae bacterium]